MNEKGKMVMTLWGERKKKDGLIKKGGRLICWGSSNKFSS